ncbi:MAG TPA: pro-sigmaK processing inhibitor BofA family protein [Syntrophomonas sp.]|jgi:inhibitor of the pro-sigma K processing machinery|nr:pro-sigmaK processing inhibitor BofA family protein [Syntrophomonas sp.]
MGMVNFVMAGLFLLVIIFIIAQIITKPIKLVWKLVINSIIGLVLLMLTNYIGAYFNFSLPLNILTVLISGFLGIPGILLLICFQLLL